MTMAFVVLSLCLLLTVLLYCASRAKRKLAFPGPKGLPFLGSCLEMRKRPVHQLFTEWSAKYGGVFAFSIFGKEYLVVSSPEALREVLITKGKDFAGRPHNFRSDLRTDGAQNIIRQNNLALHRVLRQISQSVLNAYGRGKGRLESILDTAVDNLVNNFHRKEGLPFDAWEDLYEATTLTIVMICPQDQAAMVTDVKELNRLILDTIELSPGSLLLDIVPAIRYLPWCPPYSKVLKCVKAQDALYEKYLLSLLDRSKETENQSLGRALLDSIGQPYGDVGQLDVGDGPGRITKANVRQVCTDMVLAGTVTTTNSFYALLGVLVCHPDIQERVAEEIAAVVGTDSSCRVTLDHKESLHYTRAVILELLRYNSVAAVGVPHVARKHTELCGTPVPAGTEVMTNLWGCHHDPNLWSEPWAFNPERFLSDEGHLVAADHPNRKQMFPFGAGIRVCLGELLASNRLLLFTANIVKEFKLLPGESGISCDARDYKFAGTTEVQKFKICAVPRNEKT